jgi:hypothetical protein
MWFVKKASAPVLTVREKVERVRKALAAGDDFHAALQEAGLTANQYGFALLQANPKARAALNAHHAQKLRWPGQP